MGIYLSRPDYGEYVKFEHLRWNADHSLQFDKVRRMSQKIMVREAFQPRDNLYLCTERRTLQGGLHYDHFFVTSQRVTIELLDEGVVIHRRQLPYPLVVEASFDMTDDVAQRMQDVCGATAYSAALRNSEHLARFIHTGAWVSFQMLEGGDLGTSLLQWMSHEDKTKLNRLPCELRRNASNKPLYSREEHRGYQGLLQYQGIQHGLQSEDMHAFNVLVIGPSGCGKSRLINHLFNRTVTESRASAHSVTREMKILYGTGKILGVPRKVNVIDTLGLVDSHISAEDVLALIQQCLRVNFVCLDQVIVVCSGRIDISHAQSIRKILHWLRQPQYKSNFTFIYNKADVLNDTDRQRSVVEMCESLGVQREVRLCPYFSQADPDRPVAARTVANCFATGFPEGARFSDVQPDLEHIWESVFCNREPKRIAVDESWCPIL